jgi:hypothetical protein
MIAGLEAEQAVGVAHDVGVDRLASARYSQLRCGRNAVPDRGLLDSPRSGRP